MSKVFFRLDNIVEGPTPDELAAMFPELAGSELDRKMQSVWATDPCINTFEVLAAVVNTPPENGFGESEIQMVVSISERLKDAEPNESRFFTPDEWNYILKRLKAFRWRVAHQRVLNLISRVALAPKVEGE